MAIHSQGLRGSGFGRGLLRVDCRLFRRQAARERGRVALGAGVAARPHQLGAVRKVCAALHADCHLPRPSNYLVQHAAGSGKSLTIAALADALTRLEDERSNRFGCIVVISDRKVLDDQLSHVVSGYLERVRCDGDGEAPQVIRAESCSHLQQMLGDSGRTRARTALRAARGRLDHAAGRRPHDDQLPQDHRSR